MDNFQNTVFKHLLTDSNYFSVVYPFMTDTIIYDQEYRILLSKIKSYVTEFSAAPNFDEVKFLIQQDSKIDESVTKDTLRVLQTIQDDKSVFKTDLIVNETERWIRDETLKNAILESVEILDTNEDRDQIYEKVKQAVLLSFKHELGSQYILDSKKQFEFYNSEEESLKCGINAINMLSNGGFRRKSLNCIIGRCVSGPTVITVRNKKTGEIQDITILEFLASFR